MRENNLLHAAIAAAAVAEIPMSVRSSPMPCGARTAFGCSRWRDRRSSIGTPSAAAGVQARRPLRRPSADLHAGLRGCMPRPPPVRRGGFLRMRSTAPDPSDHFTNQIDLGQAVTPSSNPQTNGVAETARSWNDRSMAASTATSRSCGTPSAGSSNSTMPSGSWRSGYLSPAQARQVWHSAMSLRPAA